MSVPRPPTDPLDPLDASALNHACRTLALPWSVRVLSEAPSTNDWLRDLGRSQDPVHTVVFAERQTAGRGRRENTWDAAPGQDLTFSLALRPDLPLPRWTRATQAAALAVCRALEAETPLKATVKWPNDIHLGPQKLCGILTESFTGHGGRYLVIGIGLNVHRQHFPDPLRARATSLALALAPQPSPARRVLALALLLALHDTLSTFSDDTAYAAQLHDLRQRDALFGLPLTLQTPTGPQTGIASGLDDDGALLLTLPDGTLTPITSAEQVRPA